PDQVPAPDSAPFDVVDDGLDCTTLVVAREDQRARLALRALSLARTRLEEGVVLQDAQQRFTLQHIPPRVVRVATGLRGGIPLVTVLGPHIERQESGRRSIELRGHEDLRTGNRELDENAAGSEQRPVLARYSSNAILLNRVLHDLLVVGLQLDCDDRDAVDGQYEVDRVALGRVAMH